jgi:hypothetical protein
MQDNDQDYTKNLVATKKNNKWGFKDGQGNIIIDFIYDQVSAGHLGIAGVQKNGKWGFVNHTGKVIVDLQYDTLGETRNALIKTGKLYTGDSFFWFPITETKEIKFDCTIDTNDLENEELFFTLYFDFGQNRVDGFNLAPTNTLQEMLSALNIAAYSKKEMLIKWTWATSDRKWVYDRDGNLLDPPQADNADGTINFKLECHNRLSYCHLSIVHNNTQFSINNKLLDEDIDLRKLISAIINGCKEALQLYGIVGYRKKSKLDFPLADYIRLKSWLAGISLNSRKPTKFPSEDLEGEDHLKFFSMLNEAILSRVCTDYDKEIELLKRQNQ